MDKELLGTILGWTAPAVMLLAFAMFNWKTLQGRTRPNVASWGAWVFIAALNCVSYFSMSGDWMKALPPLAASLACIATFFIALFNGKLTKLNRMDSAVLAMGLLVSLAWWIFKSAAFANMILQAAFVVTIMPTLRDIWRKPEAESALPWLTWTVSYALLVVVVVLRWRDNPADLVYPITGITCYGLAGILALRKT